MGAKLSLQNSTSWHRINLMHGDLHGDPNKMVKETVSKVTGASNVSTSWRCSSVDIADTGTHGAYRIIAGSREPSGRSACQVKVWDVTGVEPIHHGADVQPRPPKILLRYGLLGHSGPVQSVAISHNLQIGVSAADDLAIIVWDLVRGKERVRIKKAHSKVMRSIRVSHEGKWGITGGYDKCVKLWNLFEGKCLGVGAAGEIGRVDTDKYGHLECVMGCDLRVVVHPGDARPGGWGCSSSFDGTVKLWDLRGMKLVVTMRGHKGHVWDSRLCQAGDENRQTLVSCGADATVRVWSVPEGNPLTVLEGHRKEVTSIALRLDGLVAATASFDMCCRTWDLRREGERNTMQLASDRSSCCGLSQDGLVLVSSAEDDSISLCVTMELIKVKVKLPTEGKKPVVVELEVDPDDGFDVLCEKLEVILCDKDQVPRDNPYAELPCRFHRFNYGREDRKSVIAIDQNSPMAISHQSSRFSLFWGSKASDGATPNPSEVNLGESQGLGGSSKFDFKGSSSALAVLSAGVGKGKAKRNRAGAKVAPVAASPAAAADSLIHHGSEEDEVEGEAHAAGGGRRRSSLIVPAFSYEQDGLKSCKDLGIVYGALLQLLKPIDPFGECTLEEIKDLGEHYEGNLWWEKQEKHAAGLLREYAVMRERLRNQRRNEKQIKEVHFEHKHGPGHGGGGSSALNKGGRSGPWKPGRRISTGTAQGAGSKK